MKYRTLQTYKQTFGQRFVLLTFGLVASVLAVSAAAAPEDKTRARPEFPISIEQAEVQAKAHRAEMFATTDTNDDGYLSVDEFVAGEHPGPAHGDSPSGRHFRPQHQRPRPLDGDQQDSAQLPSATDLAEMEGAIFALLDQDGNGELSRQEFSREKQQAAQQTIMKTRMFQHLDKNKDQLLTIDELPSPIDRLRQADANSDGEVSAEEMRATMRKRGHGA